MRLGIMQPYLFPYLGYFQLIRSVDTYVFYDDVNYIKRGWVNRNRILLHGEPHFLTVPCVKPSQNKLICDTQVNYELDWRSGVSKTLEHAYSKSPNYEVVMEVLNRVLAEPYDSISAFNIAGIIAISEYLGMKKTWKISSEQAYGNTELKKADRLIDICQKEGVADYVNAIGGTAIYEKDYFQERGVTLRFLDPVLKPYSQNAPTFVAGLSIIDLLMVMSPEEVLDFMDDYSFF